MKLLDVLREPGQSDELRYPISSVKWISSRMRKLSLRTDAQIDQGKIERKRGVNDESPESAERLAFR